MPRKDASSWRTKSFKRKTKHKSKKNTKEEKNEQLYIDQEQINSKQKKKPKDLRITHEVRKTIKVIETEEETDF